MNVSLWATASAAFLASAVEMVEALSIVLAVGFTQGFPAAIIGTVWALVALGAIVAAGIPLLHIIPEMWLKIGVGAFAIWFGWGWLRKAVLRASGRMAHRDEDAAYEKQVKELSAKDKRVGIATAFSGVFVEGLEVALIVLAIGGASPRSLLAAVAGATAALIIVVAAGVVLHTPLSRVPENVIKYVVGVMLTSFGIYWMGEGIGISWPGDEFALLWLAVIVAAASFVAVGLLKRTSASVA